MRFNLVFAAALLCGATLAGSAQAQPAYTLQCRGGGAMNVNISGAAPAVTELVIGFTRATVTRALPAGTCAWMDRPMNTAEPASIRLVVNARMNVDLRPRPGDHAGDRADMFVYAGSRADVAYAQSIVNTLKAGGNFTVQAYNPGRGPMVASSFRPAP